MIQNNNNIKIKLRVVQNSYVKRPEVKLLEYVLKTRHSFVNDFCEWRISPYMPLHPDGWTITRRDDYLVEFTVHDNGRVYELIKVFKTCQSVFSVKTEFILYFFSKRIAINNKIILFFYFWVLNTKLYNYLNSLYLNNVCLNKIKKKKLKKIKLKALKSEYRRVAVLIVFKSYQKQIFIFKNKKTSNK